MTTEINYLLDYGAWGLVVFMVVFDRTMLLKELKEVGNKLEKVIMRYKDDPR